ncbi:putative huntingtin-interacting protein 1-like isoform X2 [Apostichopus japonicus]|uniref:Putative huntingtin-interacting protein 1-like isoform X2 n=1 Tax=Stichopus japonicus TaxID=307972 RepID=A0A2G8L9I5_STIJA|nr:putative huntingtin-interacting protein 1-like isoform X2 [Apostichopus japonicus]
MASGYQTLLTRSTEKTMSYKQLKSDHRNILKEHGELQNKLSKQQTQLHNAKSARKRLEKENHELKEQISQEERMHKEALSDVSEKLGASNANLESKVEAFEKELEKLGIDPVSFEKLPAEDSEEKQREVKAIVDQCKILQEEANAQTEVTT